MRRLSEEGREIASLVCTEEEHHIEVRRLSEEGREVAGLVQ